MQSIPAQTAYGNNPIQNARSTHIEHSEIVQAACNVAQLSKIFKSNGETQHTDAMILQHLPSQETILSTSTVSRLIRELALSQLKELQVNELFTRQPKGLTELVAKLPKVERLVFKSRKVSEIKCIDIKDIETSGWASLKEIDLRAFDIRSNTISFGQNNRPLPYIFSELMLPGIETFRFDVKATLAGDSLNLAKNIEILCKNNPDLTTIDISGMLLNKRTRAIQNVEILTTVAAELSLSASFGASDHGEAGHWGANQLNHATLLFLKLLNMPNLKQLTTHATENKPFDAPALETEINGNLADITRLKSITITGVNEQYAGVFEQLRTAIPSLTELHFHPAPSLST